MKGRDTAPAVLASILLAGVLLVALFLLRDTNLDHATPDSPRVPAEAASPTTFLERVQQAPPTAGNRLRIEQAANEVPQSALLPGEGLSVRSVFSSDPDIHNLRVLESQLTDFRQASDSGKFDAASAVICKSISTILDQQNRSEPAGDGTKTKLVFPSKDSTDRMFIHNDRTYRFESWEFPEFVEWADTMSEIAGRPADAARQKMPAGLALSIEARALEAISILEHKTGGQSK